MDKVPAFGGGIGIIDDAEYDFDFSPEEEDAWEVSIDVTSDEEDADKIKETVHHNVIDFIHSLIWRMIHAKTGSMDVNVRDARRYVNLAEINSICANHGITNPENAFPYFMSSKDLLPDEAYENIHVNINVESTEA